MNDELPDSWIRAPFSAVTVDPIQCVPSEKEKITYIDIGSVDRDTKTIVEPQSMFGKDAPSRARKVIQTGDVLVSTVRPNLNAVALVESQYDGQFASTGFDVLRSPVVDSRWLFYSVRTPEFLDRMSELVQGALYPAVRSKDIRSFVIPIAPLAEQKRIADKLEAVLGRVDACRARLDRVPALLKRFRQSILASATSGKLTEEWRMTNGVSDEWEEVQLKEIATEIFDGPFGSHLKTADYTDSGIRVARLENIGWMTFFADKEAFISLSKYKTLTRHTLKVDDVMFSSFISEEIRVAMLPKSWSGKAINKSDCFCLRADKRRCLPKFLMQRLACRSTFAILGEGIHGATRPRINLGQLKGFSIALPTLPEQQEIVRRVEALFVFADRIEARLATEQKIIERLTPATLAKAFRGELVPQDPNDEPAFVLLNRIAEERFELQPNTKRVSKKRISNAS